MPGSIFVQHAHALSSNDSTGHLDLNRPDTDRRAAHEVEKSLPIQTDIQKCPQVCEQSRQSVFQVLRCRVSSFPRIIFQTKCRMNCAKTHFTVHLKSGMFTTPNQLVLVHALAEEPANLIVEVKGQPHNSLVNSVKTLLIDHLQFDVAFNWHSPSPNTGDSAARSPK